MEAKGLGQSHPRVDKYRFPGCRFAMNPTLHVTFCGRTFTAQEVELMRTVAQDYAGLGVTEIARTICELLEWKRPSGGLKNHECRQLATPGATYAVILPGKPILNHDG